MNLDAAVVYDLECFPNYFVCNATGLFHDYWLEFEISPWRNDLTAFYNWLVYLHENQVPMIGYNNIHYDYRMIHPVFQRPGDTTNESLYTKNQEIIGSNDRFAGTIWPRDRYAPQIDLMLVHHFDNKQKQQSLKGLEFNMRSHSVMETKVPFGTVLTEAQVIENRSYGKHDVAETKRFAHISMDMLKFRQSIMGQLDGDVMNFNDTKIGKEMLVQRLGRGLTHERRWISTGFNGEGYFKNEVRQTVRHTIPLRDVIVPYIQFTHPEFQRIHQWMLAQTLTPADLDDAEGRASTKGVFSGVTANINGFTFVYGTGGLHGSVSAQHFKADAENMIYDIDVGGYYPNFAIANKLYPEHLGDAFVAEYAKLPIERKHWQKTKGKKCYEANALKLAGNGSYGASNDIYSALYDPKFTMAITINGQLLLSMLAEWLIAIPSVQMVQANTDGITIKCHRSVQPQVDAACHRWEALTMLTLEYAEYSDMWIRDVNNYTARGVDGSMKLKGAYWFPRNFPDDITNAQPSAWYKDLSSPVIQRAVEQFHLYGLDPAIFIRCHTDPFDFMMRAKVDRSSHLFIGEQRVQRITRYYVAKQGGALRKVSPPAAGNEPGQYKRRPKTQVSDAEYMAVMREIGPNVWDARIHTKNKAVYDDREMSLQAGWLVAECNEADQFRFDNLNYDYYIAEARKLLIV